MDLEKIVALFECPSDEARCALLEDRASVFWIDWRQEDETIPEACDAVLQTGELSATLEEAGTGGGLAVDIRYRDRRLSVPLEDDEGDRHRALLGLNRVLHPDYEVRLCVDSAGGDTLAFLPLPCSVWAELEGRYQEAVGRHFYRFTDRPNLFTDPLPF